MIYYLVGIKGTGMSALAKILISDGHIVSGVDVKEDFFTTKHINACIDDFSCMILKKSYFYVIGNAYKNHSVTGYIKKSNCYYMDYPQFINFYFSKLRLISIAGSHGKTFTSSLLSHIYDKSYALIGDGKGRAGKDSLILESCEYKDTFLNYKPDISLILNVDYDHPDYFKSEDDYAKSFVTFASNSKICILNNDDFNSKRFSGSNIISYGIDNSDIIFRYSIIDDKTYVYVLNNEFVLNYPGHHYAYNFMGCYIILKLLGIDDDYIKNKLKSFKLPYRRFLITNKNDINYILDYAHHPTEIMALYESTTLKFKTNNIILFYEPHTLSRSIALKDRFKKAFSLFKKVYLLETFSSVREHKDYKKEDELYKYFGYPKISIKEIEDYDYEKGTVYCFLGAGRIDITYKKIVKI